MTRYGILIVMGLLVGLGMGCGRTKPTEQPPAVDTVKLPGAAEVMAALEKKDYDGAMAAWAKARQSITTEEQQAQFMMLSRELKMKVAEAAPTDPKAAQALEALRAVTMGR